MMAGRMLKGISWVTKWETFGIWCLFSFSSSHYWPDSLSSSLTTSPYSYFLAWTNSTLLFSAIGSDPCLPHVCMFLQTITLGIWMAIWVGCMGQNLIECFSWCNTIWLLTTFPHRLL